MVKVSVIIPVYNVARFVDRCARSLFGQTVCEDVEFIFVDDATPDDSIRIVETCLADFPGRKEQTRILRHAENKGLPAARNTGLAAARGEYVLHCDSDDFAEPDMIERLVEAADRTEADIVWCDWLLSLGRDERILRQPDYPTPTDALRGMLSGAMKYNVWNKLVRRSLYTDNGITFPAGYGMGEDMTMIRLMACARRTAYVPKALYHYVKLNAGAFSNTYSDRHIAELRYNVDMTMAFLQARYGSALDRELAFFKLEAKFPFLLFADRRKQRLWREWYPEANRYILANNHISLRSRLVQWCAWRRQMWAVRLYGMLLRRVVYGLIYK